MVDYQSRYEELIISNKFEELARVIPNKVPKDTGRKELAVARIKAVVSYIGNEEQLQQDIYSDWIEGLLNNESRINSGDDINTMCEWFDAYGVDTFKLQ